MIVWRSELEYQQRLAGHWQAIAARANADAIKWHREAHRAYGQRNEAWDESRRISAILATSDQRGVEVYTRMMEDAYGCRIT